MGVYFTKDPKNFSSQIQGGNNYVCTLLRVLEGKTGNFSGISTFPIGFKTFMSRYSSGWNIYKKKVEKTQEKVHTPNKSRSGGDL